MTPNRRIVVAIDGPSGAGKSTVARAVAKRLGILFLDTGAMYRAVAWALLEQAELGKGGVGTDEAAIAAFLRRLRLRFSEDGERISVQLDSGLARDVSAEIRTPRVTSVVSQVSAVPIVREMLTREQRAIAAGRSVVAEGRDTTTVVFPHCDRKFFLTASLEERARRRKAERPELEALSVQEVADEIAVRDQRDSTRSLAPLRMAADAVLIDTTGLSLDEVVERIVRECAELLPIA